MTFLTPIAALIAAGITVPLLVAMYFLKLRRRVMVVSSTLLWRRAVQDMRVNSPFQKLRRNLLLLLQLLLLAALLLALARPLSTIGARSGSRIVILLDRGASMNATDVNPSRLEKAKELALKMIDEQDFVGTGGAMVVAFARDARVVQPFTSDKALLRAAVHTIEPTDLLSDLAPALRLIAPYVAPASGNAAGAAGIQAPATGSQAGSGSGGTAVYVFSDGQVARGEGLSLRGGDIYYFRIGDTNATPIDNLAITSLSARRDPASPKYTAVIARLANYGAAPVHANVTFSVDSRVQKVIPVEVPARHLAPQPENAAAPVPAPSWMAGIREERIDLMLHTGALVTVAHDHEDQLASDNIASLMLAPPLQMQVLLVTPGNGFLERAVRATVVRKLVVKTPQEYEDENPRLLLRGAGGAEDEGFDVLVFDGYSPRTVPLVPSLYLGGAPPIDGVGRVPSGPGEPKMQEVLNRDREHPALRYVDLEHVWIMEPGRLRLPDRATVLAIGQAGPVMGDLTDHGVRHILTSFPVLNTNWPMRPSFVVFVTNALRTLTDSASIAVIRCQPGDVAMVPAEAAAKSLTYRGPATLQAPVENGRAVLPMFEHVGLYRCDGGAITPWEQVPVNLCDEVASDLHAPRQLAVHAASQMSISQTEAARQEVWHWFMWGAIGLLLVEWLVFVRRATY